MKSLCLIFLFVLLGSHSHAKIYTWVDENGTKHFSDDPSRAPHALQAEVKTIDEPATGAQNISPPVMHGVPGEREGVATYPRDSFEFRQLERQLIKKWEAMKQALGENRVEDALTYFMHSSRPSFRSRFLALGDKLPDFVEKLGPTRLIKVHEDLQAECDLRHKKNGRTYSFMLQFVRDYEYDNEWRIRAF